MRFHVLGLPHTVTTKEYSACAFTQKVYKFCEMMKPRGHEIIHYGHEDSNPMCDENVVCTTNDTLQQAYGNYDWKKGFFKYDINDSAHKTFTTNAVREINKRKRRTDIVLPFWGLGHKAVIDQMNNIIPIEPGIGYPSGPFCRWKIFESYAIMHAWQGLKNVATCQQDHYDVVIPNYFNPQDFTFQPNKEDYFLFLGRVYPGKGVEIAIQVTEKLGKKLIIAGQSDGSIKFPKHVEYVGYADPEKRRSLMANAKASFLPSMYLEPFGGVAIENLLSGTPIITTDWGAFPEYNTNGETGYRCRTFKDFCDAASKIDGISPYKCREVGERYSYAAVAPQYEKYFQDVLNVYEGDGWYQT
jgi:glycosyltransferase involved in cell wall biosynthesis